MQLPSVSFGTALRQALKALKMSQAVLAGEVGVEPSQVSKWVHDIHMPNEDHLEAIRDILKGYLEWSAPATQRLDRLYVASPITGFSPAFYKDHYRIVSRIVAEARLVVDHVDWPGAEVVSMADLKTPWVATEANMKLLGRASGLLYLQFAPVHQGSSALLELGIALGRKMRTTAIFGPGVPQPFLLKNGFDGVAERIDFLPSARVQQLSPDSACSEIRATGATFFGMDPRRDGPSPAEPDLWGN